MTNETEKELPTIADDLVVTKYKMAAEIVNREYNYVFHSLNKMVYIGFSMDLAELLQEILILQVLLRKLSVDAKRDNQFVNCV